MTQFPQTRLRLEARLAELEQRSHAVRRALATEGSKDWEDLAVEREGDEVLEDLDLAGHREVAQIRAALDRIAAGTYGICAHCGTPIAEVRLASLPETPFCKDCAP